MFVDNDSRRLYSIQDLTLDELRALRRAIRHADLPDRGTLERLRKHLDGVDGDFSPSPRTSGCTG